MKNLIASGHPIIWLRTAEEKRATDLLMELAEVVFGQCDLNRWDIASGWSRQQRQGKEQRNSPALALKEISTAEAPGFYVLYDFVKLLDASSCRMLRNFYQKASAEFSGKFIFLVGPDGQLPGDLLHEVAIVELPMPSADEISAMVSRYPFDMPGNGNGAALRKTLTSALRGLRQPAIDHIMRGFLSAPPQTIDDMLARLYRLKEQRVRDEGFLEFMAPGITIRDVGGMDNVKEWLLQRKEFFCSPGGNPYTIPRGILFTGISGTGKTLAVKLISSLWNTPVFRLRMANIFGGQGSPEERFLRCLRLVEETAPVIFFLDEIEKILSLDAHIGGGAGAGGQNSRIVSEFLSWMQDHPPYIFVAATANRIEALPAELIRRGRFDQIFFVDLPNDEERKFIFGIHARRMGLDPEAFDLTRLSLASRGWNGAEIEQAVQSAVIEGRAAGKTVTMELLLEKISKLVPLSVTQASQIAALQKWALQRATPASKFTIFRNRET